MSPDAHDDDDITTPARPTARPTARPVGSSAGGPAPAMPVAGKASAALRWGAIGSLHRVEPLTLLPGQTGVVRLLPNTIKYARPPVDIAWSEVKAEPGRFEMAWPGNPATARSLEDVGADLRKQRTSYGELPADHAGCKELDAGVAAMLQTAERLGRQGWGVGLLTPAGVMLHQSSNGLEAVPVDLGFTWTGEFGDPPWDHSPGRPSWLTPDTLDNPAAEVWDRPPVEQQFAQPGGSPFPKPDPTSDVRTLARVIAWAMTGRPSRDIPRDEKAPVWDVLREAAAGRISSPKALADRLQDYPPSAHFTVAPKPIELVPDDFDRRPPPKKKSALPLVLAGLAALLVLGGGTAAALIFFLNKQDRVAATTPGTTEATTRPTETRATTRPTTTQPTTRPTAAATRPTTRPTETRPTVKLPPPASEEAKRLIAAYNKVPAEDIPARMAAFRPLAAAAKKADDREINRQVAAIRETLFKDWVGAAEKQVAAASAAAKRGEAGAALRRLADSYQALHKDFPPTDKTLNDKEQQWVNEYDRQAELLGWPR